MFSIFIDIKIYHFIYWTLVFPCCLYGFFFPQRIHKTIRQLEWNKPKESKDILFSFV